METRRPGECINLYRIAALVNRVCRRITRSCCRRLLPEALPLVAGVVHFDETQVNFFSAFP